jgi:uncharacterized protein YndB with AHSA1/START domain
MPTTTATIDVDIAQPPSVVYDALTRLGTLRERLGTSTTYRGTHDVSHEPVRVGSTYADQTPIGRFQGHVLELEPDRRVVFRQVTTRNDLDIKITYALEPTASGTRLVRTGEITTRGLLALVHPIVVRSTGAENRRTMNALKASLDGDGRRPLG